MALFFGAIFFFIVSAQEVFAEDKAESSYVDSLKSQAKEKGLQDSLKWKALVHYWGNWVLSGYESFADDPKFFLSKKGKSNSEQELFSTIEAFFKKPTADHNKHAICRFPARFEWLDSKLSFDNDKLPKVKCDELDLWFEGLDAKSLSLVFPATYLNSPASSFGHTFLRINSTSSEQNSGPLAYVANYGADTRDPIGLSYAIKGIFGLYKGNFSVAPYYKLLKKYGDVENRDIWEYELSFTKKEVHFLLKHLWELKGIDFDYYFFGENCSFLLLSLFDAVRPELKLQEKFPFWAIPLDTIREVLEEKNILVEANFRPSLKSRFDSRVKQASRKEKNALKSVLSKDAFNNNQLLNELDKPEKARVFDLALDYLSLANSDKSFLKAKDKEKEVRKYGYQLLLERSKLDDKELFSKIEPPSTRPDQGHLTRKFELSFGKEDNDNFYDFKLRPAYHDLLSPNKGYVFGSELKVFEVGVRAYEDDKLRFQRFSPLMIKSLSPSDEFLKENSWSFELALERTRLPAFKDSTQENFQREDFRFENMLGLDAYYGKARNLFSSNILAYFLLGVKGEYENSYQDNLAFGPGVSAGLLLSSQDRFRFNITGKAAHFAIGEKHEEASGGFKGSYTLSRNLALILNAERVKKFDLYYSRLSSGLEIYF